MGNLLGLTQNAQSTSNQQTRSYSYDWMSRRISETVPEIGTSGNGTVTYTYDSDSTCGASNGDIVKRIDAAGNVRCSTFDLLHRRLTITYPSGTYASVTPSKNFVYDAATVNGQAMTTVQGRLAEAYTCFSPCSTKITDIGLSYSARGEPYALWESTSHSSGYNLVGEYYWANRATNRIVNYFAMPNITYGVDGEGRINTASDSGGVTILSSTTYNAASLPTGVTYGSGDADSFTFDPNTNRMSQYKFTVNGTSLTANLGWNANGTMQSQSITDGFNSADTQNCSYTYDDMTRLSNASCGSAAAQTFSYDTFGNINKSGTPYSFSPTYSSSTNRMTSVAGFTPTYDGNGNVLNDSFHNYTWDADGHAISVDAGLSDAVNLTYDALGRMAEQNRSGAYTQIVYAPDGQKLALMSGSTLQKGLASLPAKAFAVYGASGLLYYAHPDFIGSIRLASSPGRSMYFDTAYAPFGETYASTGTLDPAYTGKMNDTGNRQDTAGGLYDFPLREYSTQGRWPSPDPAGFSAACIKNPQTQNRYAYVRNNPMSYTDPTGGYGISINVPVYITGCFLDDDACNDPCFQNPLLCYQPFPVFRGGGGGGGQQESRCGNVVNPITFEGFKQEIACTGKHKPASAQVSGIKDGVKVLNMLAEADRNIDLIGKPYPNALNEFIYYQDFTTNLGGTITWTLQWSCYGKKQSDLYSQSEITCKEDK
jgi:RHS repeat-associated protein